MAKSHKSLEDAIGELKTVIEKLETDETSLDNSFKLYNEGLKLIKYCNESIDKVEKKLIIINEAGANNEF